MRLQQRDLILLEDLYHVKYLNSSRISRLYGNYKASMRRLKLLREHGYVRLVDMLESGEHVFSVTKKTCGTLSLPYMTTTKTDKLKHALACADLYFHLRQNNTPINKFELENQYHFKHKGKKYVFRPDVTLTTNKPLLVEIDLSNRRFEDKVKKWESFYHSSHYLKSFTKFPPILIVSTNVPKVIPIIEKNKSIDLNYIYKDYLEVSKWEYQYSL